MTDIRNSCKDLRKKSFMGKKMDVKLYADDSHKNTKKLCRALIPRREVPAG
jgi:hypothetical protein